SLIFMGFLTIFGTGSGAYIMAMASLSPCPLLVHSAYGTVVIVRPLFFKSCMFCLLRCLVPASALQRRKADSHVSHPLVFCGVSFQSGILMHQLKSIWFKI
ncbi:hypothetical protein XENORESO_019296, partial [Xenotaenia resolanae]